MNKKKPFISNQRLNVFIADDDPDDIEFFTAAVKAISPKIKITIAKNGLEMLEFVQIVIPDIIFLDINMPCMNGLDCLAELRRHRHLEHVAIIMYSTGIKEEHIEQSYALGANRYIKKPVYYTSLKEQLSSVFSWNLDELLSRPSRDKYFLNMDQVMSG